MKINKADLMRKGRDALFARVKAELKHANDEKSHEQFDDAKSTIDRYLDAAQQRQTDMPSSEDLAFACAILLLTTQAMEQSDFDFLGALCAPELGVDMFGLAPRVAELKARAIARPETTAKQHASTPPAVVGDDSIPF
ncbi:hypothetical protein [Herbaspirillum sp. VT-16-41]|uniref:hypothetical protein n=1 Tax=Herbaspirillum sp. VT-16-41 TaxID=1953765 RepID=UPI000982486F|nr:hypothetical protein [Herbaspirillum sp. VT-16-41]ONN67806.1 hypothetical protein BTM36_04545 [Herbaspirillum sp. VT-16-41]